MRKKFKNLFTRYFLVILAIMMITGIVLGGAMGLSIYSYVSTTQTELLATNSRSIASNLVALNRREVDLSNSDLTQVMTGSLSLLSANLGADVFICGEDGRVVICGHGIAYSAVRPECGHYDGNFQIPPDVLAVATAGGEYSDTSRLSGLLDGEELVVVIPVILPASPTVAGYVCAMQDVSEILNPLLAEFFKIFLFSGIIALALACVGVYLLTYHIVSPLREMSNATKSYAKGDFTYRVPVTGNDELTELEEGFNTMARDLGILEASRRSFVANVSHELKTPMTTIGGFIDGILDGTIPKEKEKYYLDIVSEEVKRLSRLVVTMLNMSKIESGELKLNPQRYDISQQLFQIMLTFEQVLTDKKVEVAGLDKLDSVFVEADKDLIHQVIYNLVDNAVKFTPEHGCISLSAAADNTRVIIAIRNSGEGIPPDELIRVFERFYKVDKSRSIDAKGAGLGLYIVKSVVEMHGGQIAVKSEVGKYTEFAFWLPANFSGHTGL